MDYFYTQLLRRALWVVIVLLAWGLVVQEVFAQIPLDAGRYKRDLIRTAHMVWGLDAPIATFAAQLHQESNWSPDARSHVGAAGMAQFMPSTAKWIATLDSELSEVDPYNPRWALRALVRYDRWLYDAVPDAATHCERMAFVLSSYNGGLGWLKRDAALAEKNGYDPRWWFDHVERFNAGRADWAFKENRGYPRRILQELEKRYRDNGWGIHSC